MPVRLASNLLGVAILVAMIAGGGTQAALASDAIVQIALLVASIFAILANRRAVLTPFLLVFPVFVLLLFVWQLTPLPIAFVKAFWDPAIRAAWDSAGATASYGVLTTSVDATLLMLGGAITAVLFFWACLNVDSADAPRLVHFFVVGWFVHLLAGLVEFVATNFSTIETALSYPINAGLFANSNHFGLFMAMGLPPLIFFFVKQKSLISGALAAVIYVLLLAVASRSALAIALVLSLFSLVAAGGSKRQIGAFVAVSAVGIGALLFSGALFSFLFKDASAPVARTEIFETTWRAIKHNPVFGSGFGSFLQIYPIYEDQLKLAHEYVNRVHNDYLETALEGGAPAVLLIAVYLAFLARLAWRIAAMRASHIRDAGTLALLAILGVLMQSAVDYPLRTWAILTTFIYCNVVLVDAVLHQDQAKTARATSSARRRRGPSASTLAHTNRAAPMPEGDPMAG